jgi:preprotein translocase subunit SecB
MKQSPLRLEQHWFSKVQIEAQPDGKVGTSNLLETQVELSCAEDDARKFQVILRLKLLPAEQEKVCYTGEIHAVGIFQVVETWPKEKVQILVESNGPAVLFSAMREMICNVTARGPWPPVLLNTFTFIPAKDKEAPTVPTAETKA